MIVLIRVYNYNTYRCPSNMCTDLTLLSNLSYFSMVCLKRIVITKKLFTDGYFPTQAKCYISSFGVYYSLEFTHFKLIIYFKIKKIKKSWGHHSVNSNRAHLRQVCQVSPRQLILEVWYWKYCPQAWYKDSTLCLKVLLKVDDVHRGSISTPVDNYILCVSRNQARFHQ